MSEYLKGDEEKGRSRGHQNQQRGSFLEALGRMWSGRQGSGHPENIWDTLPYTDPGTILGKEKDIVLIGTSKIRFRAIMAYKGIRCISKTFGT